MREFLSVLAITLVALTGMRGQDTVAPADVANEAPDTSAQDTDTLEPLQEASVELEIDASSFFTDMAINAVIAFPELVAEPLEIPEGDVSVIQLDVSETYNNDEIAAYASISLMPRSPGLITIPSFEFQSDSTAYRTQAKQILVSTPVESDAMSFSMTPAKSVVYAGEPFRIDVEWNVDLVTNQIRSLRCFPEIFSYPNSEIVIPRNTDPEELQMGMPFGGRRIITKRIPPPGDQPNKQFEKFGKVTFPIFVKFHEPGTVELPEAKLEIAHLKGKGGAFAPYAAYFNNGLFEPLNGLEAFDRYYAKASALTIEVLPLPEEGRTENFSGLFAPCRIESSLTDDEVEVGAVVEIGLRVFSDAPHGMLELPALGVQRSLRGRFRPGAEYGRTWYEDGTGFLGRVRTLTTGVNAVPSLQFQIFDPVRGSYQTIQTEAQPLTVNPSNGKEFFDIRSLAPESTLTNQLGGVWHNAQPGTMRDLMNQTIGFFAENMLLLILIGVGLYFLLLPWVKERRRRATHEVYRAQAEAYEAFKKLPERSEAKWQAFLNFLATGFSMPGGAWTPGDMKRLLDTGISDEDIQQVIDTHARVDATDFASHKPESEVPELNALARRLFDHFRKAVPVFAAGLLLCSANARADNWNDGETLFGEALAATPGEPATESLFTQSALKFEAAASDGTRNGAAWYNAGNAWFQAGEIGRAISCYRQARIYRPFDEAITDSLAAARALSIDVVEDRRGLQLKSIPVRWLSATLVAGAWLFLTCLLIHRRFRSHTTLSGVIVTLVLLIGVTTLTALVSSHSESEGVVVTSSLYGRKGPAYSYEQAFNESLHDGLEFRILDERNEWLMVQLADERQCWIPADQVRRIRNARK